MSSNDEKENLLIDKDPNAMDFGRSELIDENTGKGTKITSSSEASKKAQIRP